MGFVLGGFGIALVAATAAVGPHLTAQTQQEANAAAEPAILLQHRGHPAATPVRTTPAKPRVALPVVLARAAKPAPLRNQTVADAPMAAPSAGSVAAEPTRGLFAAGDSIQSDEFNSTSLNGALWRFENPVGDATVTVNGAQAAISLPAGVSHDLWTGSLGAARLLQDVPNQDFEVEVKLDSAFGGAGNKLQGIVVQQDADDLLRLEVHFDGSATRLFAAVIAGGVASSQHYSTVASASSTYLRVARTGNQWTLRHSTDGTNWTTTATFSHAMTVTSVGPFIGNSGGSAPAFVGLVDYFRVISAPPPPAVDTSPPVISGVSVTPGSVAATVSWTTNEPATSEVAYGTTAAYGATVTSSTLKTSHRAVLRGLRCGTVYHFQLRSADALGNQGSTADASLQTNACSTSIRSDEFNAPSLDTGIWTFVDPVGDASVAVTGSAAQIGVPAGTAHDVWAGVDSVARMLQPVPNADFEVEVKFNQAVTSAFQQQGIFVEQDATNLLRLELHNDGGGTRLFAAAIAGGSATVLHYGTVSVGAPVYLRLKRVGNAWTLSYSSNGATWTTGATFSYAMTVNAIGPLVGNGGSPPPAFTSSIDYFRQVLPDGSPPLVSAVSTTPQKISATVAWTTDELASSRLAYGTTTAYELGIASTGGSRTSHSLLVHGLRCATTYHFQVRSVDLSGNQAAAPDGSFADGVRALRPWCRTSSTRRRSTRTAGRLGRPARRRHRLEHRQAGARSRFPPGTSTTCGPASTRSRGCFRPRRTTTSRSRSSSTRR